MGLESIKLWHGKHVPLPGWNSLTLHAQCTDNRKISPGKKAIHQFSNIGRSHFFYELCDTQKRLVYNKLATLSRYRLGQNLNAPFWSQGLQLRWLISTHSLTADWLAQLVERRTTVREVTGSIPSPDQHSGS